MQTVWLSLCVEQHACHQSLWINIAPQVQPQPVKCLLNPCDACCARLQFAAYPWRVLPSTIVAACKGSLRRLGTEQLSIGQLHWSAANYAPLQVRGRSALTGLLCSYAVVFGGQFVDENNMYL